MQRTPLVVIVAFFCAGFCPTSARAAVNYTVTQTSPVPGSALFNMGGASSITFRIANTSTAGESITIVRFRIDTGACGAAPCTGSVFSTTTPTPAGWTRTYAAGTLTFTASAVANRIPAGGTKDFTIVFTMGRMTVNYTQTLRDVRATFSTGARSTKNTPGSWTLYSLNITALQTTNCAGSAVSSIGGGDDFCVDMTVRNNSSTTQNGIVSNPNPIDALPANVGKTGTVTQGWISTNPAAGLNLATLASGVITYRYSTSADDTGTIQFVNIIAQRIATVTSRSANSNILVVDPLSIAISIGGPTAGAPTCLFSGETATFSMTITNIAATAINAITPSALSPCIPCTPVTLPACDPPECTATFGAFSAPSPASIASLAPGASAAFTWTAPMTETIVADTPKAPFWVTGNLSYTSTTTTPTTYYVRAIAPGVDVGVHGTTNLTVLNDYNVSFGNAAFTVAAGNRLLVIWAFDMTLTRPAYLWGRASSDTPSGHQSITIRRVGTGTVTSPTVTSAREDVDGYVVDLAPAPADRLPNPPPGFLPEAGNFKLVFPATPPWAGVPVTYTFDVTITDANAPPIVKTLPTTITVNSFDPSPGGGNYSKPAVWGEKY